MKIEGWPRYAAECRTEWQNLERALAGQLGPHQRFLIAQHLAHIDFLDEAVAQVSAEIEECTRPFKEAMARLDAILGVGRRTTFRGAGSAGGGAPPR